MALFLVSCGFFRGSAFLRFQRRRFDLVGELLTDADRVLATVLYLRKLCTQAVLAGLFAVDRSRITEAVQATRPLLEERGHAITPATARFPAPADLAAFLAIENDDEPVTRKPAC